MNSRKSESLPWQERLFLTPAMAAQVASISRSKMYELLGARIIPSIRVGRNVKVSVDGLREWARAQENAS